jgi:hypothetical protein
MAEPAVEQAKALLEAAGYVVLREKSYRQAQTRQAIHQREAEWAERQAESARRWARECLAKERHLAERCTYLYGLAAALGATETQLRGADMAALVREDTP